MLHILLLILKIIGIIIAVILGLILFLVLVILFVPIRYKINADYYGKPKVLVKINWILHMVRARIKYDENGLDIYAKALFFYIYKTSDDNQESTEGTKKKQKSKKTVNRKEEKNVFDDKSEIKNIKEVSQTKTLDKEINTADIHKQVSEQYNDTLNTDAFDVNDNNEDECILDENKCLENKQTFIEKTISVLKSVYGKILSIVRDIEDTILGIFHKSEEAVNRAKSKYDEIKQKVTNPENIEVVKFLWAQVKHLLKLLSPKRYNVNVRYGFEDSEMTGWVAVRLAVLYGLMGMDVNIVPDFDNNVLEGNVYMKGRIRIFSLLIIALRLYRNKSFRKLINK